MSDSRTWKLDSTQALAILRVSSYGQKDNTSRDVQDTEITAYATGHGLSIVKREPIVESAKDSENRDKYHAAIAWALANKVRHLLFYMSDRESRNFTDMERMEKLILQDKIVVHYVRDRKQLHRWSPPSDFSMREIQTWQDKQLSRTISVKVNDAMLKKAEDGWYPGNIPPLGYKHQKRKDEFGNELKRGTTIVRDPEERKVRQVQREYELRAQRLSYEEIRRTIIEEGFIPAHKARSYFPGCIEQRLKNPFYRGTFTWQGNQYRGKHPLIIDAEVLRAVDATFGNKTPVRRAGDAAGIFAGGWLRCGHPDCGCSIVYDPKKKFNKETNVAKIYPFYHCTNGKSVHDSMKGMNVTEEKIWSQLSVVVDTVTITEELAQQIADALNETKLKAQEAIRREMDQYRVAQQDLVDRENKLFDLFLAGSLDETTYKTQRARLQAKQREYTNL
jgi:site-specific DNA recombinase